MKSLEKIVKNQDVFDIIDFVTDGNESGVSFLDDDDENEGNEVQESSLIDNLDSNVETNRISGDKNQLNVDSCGDSGSEADCCFKALVANERSPPPTDEVSDVDDDITIEELMRECPRRSSRSTKASITPGSSRLISNEPSVVPGTSHPISNEPSVVPDSNAVTPNPKPRAYRWRRREKSRVNTSFTTTFSEPPGEMTPLKYFYMFFPEALIQTVVTQSNLYSVQKNQKCVDTDEEEMKSFIGNVLMGIVKLPSYLDYWNRTLRYPRIADVMPRNRFSELRRYLHFVDNNAPHDNGDKLFKISPIIEAVRKECMKIEPEEYQSVDEQIIPSKTKHSKIRQYNPKKTHKMGI